MPVFLAARRRSHWIEPLGPAHGANALEAVLEAQRIHGPDCGVMPQRAVDEWMRQGAALNEAFQRGRVGRP
jgi:hypothetical protein